MCERAVFRYSAAVRYQSTSTAVSRLVYVHFVSRPTSFFIIITIPAYLRLTAVNMTPLRMREVGP